MFNHQIFPKSNAIIIIIIVFLFIFGFGCGGYITENAYPIKEDYSDRNLEYYIPSDYDGSEPLPIVFVFHGGNSSGMSMHLFTNFDEYAEENNFIVIYPSANLGWWNCNDACSEEHGDNYNDLGYVDYLIVKFNTEYLIDNNRIYATGFSLGAIFTYSLVTERTGTFAAIAPVAGAMRVSSSLKFYYSDKIPIMIVQGSRDSWNGFQSGICERYSIPDLVSIWAAHNGCDLNPTIEHYPDTGEDYIHVVCETYNNCTDNIETILIKVEGGIHEWFQFEEFDATETIVEFFLRHSL